MEKNQSFGLSKKTKFLLLTSISSWIIVNQYKKLKQNDPLKTRQAIWNPFLSFVYPALNKLLGTNLMHSLFLNAGYFQLLPLPDIPVNPEQNLVIRTKTGYNFKTPIGLGPYFDTSSLCPDSLLGTGPSFLELGPAIPEDNINLSLIRKKFQVDFNVNLNQKNTVSIQKSELTQSCNVIVQKLLERQFHIRDGKIKPQPNSIVGVNILASPQTIRSIPYLTHNDYSNQVRDLIDLCDYLVVNISEDRQQAGIVQYYKNEKSLDKLLNEVLLKQWQYFYLTTNPIKLSTYQNKIQILEKINYTISFYLRPKHFLFFYTQVLIQSYKIEFILIIIKSRNTELGKIAAYEYELKQNDSPDYSTSVSKSYLRNSIISTLKPQMLFLQVDINNLPNQENFLNSLISKCKQYGITGVVLSEESQEQALQNIQKFRKIDKQKDLVLMVNSRNMNKAQEAYEQIQSGADLLQVYDGLILQGPYVTRDFQIELQSLMQQNNEKDVNQIYKVNQ